MLGGKVHSHAKKAVITTVYVCVMKRHLGGHGREEKRGLKAEARISCSWEREQEETACFAAGACYGGRQGRKKVRAVDQP